MNDIKFSLILPTRNRPDLLTRFLNSLRDTTMHPDWIEVLVVVDEDDQTMKGYTYDSLPTKVIEVAKGLPMGALNMAGYRASCGEYIFLVNDDIIARTHGWDHRLDEEFRRFPDGIVLMHVNDLLFKSHLCTFPCVTRTFCERVGGICPEVYHRHRIDDHVYSLFNMVSYLGEKRIVYLPDVIFEHDHYVINEQGEREYAMTASIHPPDADFFERSFKDRKAQVVELMNHIRDCRQRELDLVLQKRLDELPDSMGIRNPQFVKVREVETTLTSKTTRVTIGVCSAHHTNDVPQRCLEAIRMHTENYELLLLDNEYYSKFNHANDMNRIMAACSTKYLVLMDDDVIVQPGWLDAMLSCMDSGTGVVTPVHTDKEGDISYCGIIFRPDRSGHHGHLFERPCVPTPIMTMSSAILLVDRDKCGHLRFDETMPKYFLDLDYGLRVWESGYKLMLAPEVPVCHIGGATLNYGSEDNLHRWEDHRQVFERKWFVTGRIDRLADERFTEHPDIIRQWTLIKKVNALMTMKTGETREKYSARARAVYDELKPVPVFNQYIVDNVWTRVKGQGGIGNGLTDPEKWPLVYLSSLYGRQIFTGAYAGYNTYFFEDAFWAVPDLYAPLFIRSLRRMNRPGLFNATTHEALLKAIDEKPAHVPQRPGDGDIVETHPLGVIVRYDNRYMACPLDSPGTPVVPGASFFSLEAARSCLFMEEPEYIEERDGYKVFKFHHMYYAAKGLVKEDFTAGTDRVKNALRAFTTPEIHHEIEFAHMGVTDEETADRLAMFCTLPPQAMTPFLAKISASVLLVHLPADREAYIGKKTLEVECLEGTYPDFDILRVSDRWKTAFREQNIRAVLLPSRYPDTWKHNLPERLGAELCGHVILLEEDGRRHSFSGECSRRLQYNKANLCTILKDVPMDKVKTVLEVGCSDGLACELITMAGARDVKGIDTSAAVNLVKTPDSVTLSRSTADALDFPDGSFDLVFSIAVMEHVDSPKKAFEEMLRVTKPGGYCYVQTAPLYFSPWGHHMPYFRNPWVHLIHTGDELIAYARANGIAKRIEQDLNIGAEHYIKGMLCPDHINGLSAPEFGFDEVVKTHDVEVIFSAYSHEGRELLPEKKRLQLWPYTFGELTDHGIQLLVKKR